MTVDEQRLLAELPLPLPPDAGAAYANTGGLYHLIAPAPDGAVKL